MKPTKTCTNCRHAKEPGFPTMPPGMLICAKPMKRPQKSVMMVHPEYASFCKCRSYVAKEETSGDER